MNERVNNKAATRIGTGRREKVNGGSIVERTSQRKREKEKMVFNGGKNRAQASKVGQR